MEGQVGNIFETQFRYPARKGGSTSNASTFQTTENTSNNSVKKESFISQETKNKHVNHMLRNSGIAAGVGVTLLAPFVILATKGKLPKPVSNFLDKRLKNLSNKMEQIREKPQMTKAEMIYLNSLQKMTKNLNSVRGLVFNFGPLKDVLFEKGLRKIGLGKVCNKITGFFEKMAVKMTSVAYKKSDSAFTAMQETFGKTNKNLLKSQHLSKIVEINGVSNTVEEWAKIAESKTQKMNVAYDTFRPQSINRRYKWLKKQFNGLGDDIYNQTYGHFKEFMKTPKRWTSFISEDLAAPSKIKFSRAISSQKKVITNSHNDVVKDLNSIVSDVENSLDLTSKESVDFLKRLKKIIGSYNLNTVSTSPESQKEILTEVNSIIHSGSKIFNDVSSQYSVPSAQKIKKSLGNIKHIIETDKKGEVEEILDIYKHILPDEEFSQIKKIAHKSKVALNDAVYTESDKFVDKMRDLKSGSALTDVGIGLLFPLGSTAIGMSMADTKEKKRSVALNLGVPLFVGLGTSMWSTIAMLSTGPSFILGLATSTLTNQICSRIDKHFKSNDAKKNGNTSASTTANRN